MQPRCSSLEKHSDWSFGKKKKEQIPLFQQPSADINSKIENWNAKSWFLPTKNVGVHCCITHNFWPQECFKRAAWSFIFSRDTWETITVTVKQGKKIPLCYFVKALKDVVIVARCCRSASTLLTFWRRALVYLFFFFLWFKHAGVNLLVFSSPLCLALDDEKKKRNLWIL